MNERWFPIPHFPGYEVSDHGLIEKNGRVVVPTQTGDGTLKVNLRRDNEAHTRSVKVLVAEAFVSNPHPNILEEFDEETVSLHPRRRPTWDTPINLDGDPTNNHWSNIEWRPRWFAWKYKRQFSLAIPDHYEHPIRNISTGRLYDNVMDAGIDDGVLWEHVYSSAMMNTTVFPTGHGYQLIG